MNKKICWAYALSPFLWVLTCLQSPFFTQAGEKLPSGYGSVDSAVQGGRVSGEFCPNTQTEIITQGFCPNYIKQYEQKALSCVSSTALEVHGSVAEI